MPGLFHDYRVALLDASFFFSRFSERVQMGLENTIIYVAATFNAEIEQYREILPDSKKAVYEANIAFLKHNKQLKTLDLKSFGEEARGLHNDTWGILTLLAGMNAKFVLITGDQLLIQRVVCHELHADIYDLSHNGFLYSRNFSSMKVHFELNNESEQPLQPGDIHTAEHTTLYRRDGSAVVLGKSIKSGVEANLYGVLGDPGLIAKIFKKNKLSAGKYNNILRTQNINRMLDISWALFPLDVLFYDEECLIPVGFTEKYAQVKGDLNDNPLYLGDIDLPDEYLNTRLSVSLELCLKIVRQVRYLSSYGFLVSDFNMSNFAPDPADGHIQMWDTDSFGYGTFFSGYCAGNQTSRTYDLSKKNGAIDFSGEALYLFVFSILALGDTPISELTGRFKYDNPNCAVGYRKALFPENLWHLFEEVFHGEKEASAEILLQQLHLARKKCAGHPELDKTYKELLSGVMEEANTSDDEEVPETPPVYPNVEEFVSDPPVYGKNDKKMPTWLKVAFAAAAFAAAAALLILL